MQDIAGYYGVPCMLTTQRMRHSKLHATAELKLAGLFTFQKLNQLVAPVVIAKRTYERHIKTQFAQACCHICRCATGKRSP